MREAKPALVAARSVCKNQDKSIYGATARIFDPLTGKVRYDLSGSHVTATAYSPDSQSLAVARDSHTLELWNGGTLLRRLCAPEKPTQ